MIDGSWVNRGQWIGPGTLVGVFSDVGNRCGDITLDGRFDIQNDVRPDFISRGEV